MPREAIIVDEDGNVVPSQKKSPRRDVRRAKGSCYGEPREGCIYSAIALAGIAVMTVIGVARSCGGEDGEEVIPQDIVTEDGGLADGGDISVSQDGQQSVVEDCTELQPYIDEARQCLRARIPEIANALVFMSDSFDDLQVAEASVSQFIESSDSIVFANCSGEPGGSAMSYDLVDTVSGESTYYNHPWVDVYFVDDPLAQLAVDVLDVNTSDIVGLSSAIYQAANYYYMMPGDGCANVVDEGVVE